MPQPEHSQSALSVIHFADAPNGDAWLAIQTENNLFAVIRRVCPAEMVEVVHAMRLLADSGLVLGERPPTASPPLSLMR